MSVFGTPSGTQRCSKSTVQVSHIWLYTTKRGGDFLIMSEPKLIKLDRPIMLDMAEVCR